MLRLRRAPTTAVSRLRVLALHARLLSSKAPSPRGETFAERNDRLRAASEAGSGVACGSAALDLGVGSSTPLVGVVGHVASAPAEVLWRANLSRCAACVEGTGFGASPRSSQPGPPPCLPGWCGVQSSS